MIKRMLLMLIAVGIVLGGFFGFQAFKASMIRKVLAKMANPPQTVSTTTASDQLWQQHLQAVGTLRAVKGANLALEVSGIVSKIGFRSGQDVAAGKVLLRLRDDNEAAKLQALQATAALAQVTFERDAKLIRSATISRSKLDTDRFDLANARALVDEQQAALDKKVLRAPFAGRLGIRAVDVGQFVNAGATVVSLQALDPIYADFLLPQQALAQIKVGQSIIATVDTWPKRKFPGKIVAIDPQVDSSSRNVRVRASLANPDHKLLPGMYATIEIDVGAPDRYVTLPQTAIAYNPYGSTVYLVHAKGAAHSAQQVFVKTGSTRGDQVAVLTGVKPGDVVVTSGQMKLHNGAPVVINNTVQPTDQAHPQVANE